MFEDISFLTRRPFAHRGLHGGAIPENCMTAFEEAVKRGYAIETDVRLTKDRTPVIFHDDSLARMTGVGKRVIDCTDAQIARVKLKGSGERIPLFGEFLDAVGGRTPLLIELKNVPEAGTKQFIRTVADALANYGGEFAVQSFQPFYVKEFKKLRPDVPCGVLAAANAEKEDFGGSPLWKIKRYLVGHMSFNFTVKPDFISYRAEDYPTRETEKFRGLKLAWTVRSPEEEDRARGFADNVIFENYLPR